MTKQSHSPRMLAELELDQVSGGAIGNIIAIAFPPDPVDGIMFGILAAYPPGPERRTVGTGGGAT